VHQRFLQALRATLTGGVPGWVLDSSQYLKASLAHVDLYGDPPTPTAGTGFPVIRAQANVALQVGAVNPVVQYGPLATTTILEVTFGVLVTVSNGENFTLSCDYTDSGNTARTFVFPFRLLTGANVLAVTAANGAIPYVGQACSFRARVGTTLKVYTGGAFGACTYSVGAAIRELSV
jgi:hypothetical protein